MNTFYCFIAVGQAKATHSLIFSADDTVPDLLRARYAPAKDYETQVIGPQAWTYPAYGTVKENGENIDWNALWNAAFRYLVDQCGVSEGAAKTALEATAKHRIGTFVPSTGKVTFGVPVENASVPKERKAFDIEIFATPPKHMGHMYQRGVAAPVALAVHFSESEPLDAEIAEAQRRTPAKPRLIGNTFVKKADDLFSFFVHSPFFQMYNMDHAADLRGNAYDRDDLPLRSADYALHQLENRVPYTQCAITRDQVEAFVALLGGALQAANTAATGDPRPKGVYNCYTTTEYGLFPYARQVIRVVNHEYIILGQAASNGIAYRCYQFNFSFYAIQVGKAYVPLRLLPRFLQS